MSDTEHQVCITRSPEIGELAAALCAAQAEFTAIPKTDTNPFFKSKYAGLPKVVEVASPIITKHGLAVSQWIGFDERGDTLTTILLHKSGQFMEGTMRLHLAKTDAQGQGSATSYARRYSYMAILGLVADEDDDGNKASRPARANAEAPKSERLSDGQRAKVLSALEDAGHPVELALAAVGVGSAEELTAAHARQIRLLLDNRQAA